MAVNLFKKMNMLYVWLVGLLLSVFVMGAAKGVSDCLQFHYGSSIFSEFKNQQFWDPEISWKNKYKDWDGGDASAAFPLSKSVLVVLTDGWHTSEAVAMIANVLAVVFGFYFGAGLTALFLAGQYDGFVGFLGSMNKMTFVLSFFSVLYFVRNTAFTLFFDVILKK